MMRREGRGSERRRARRGGGGGGGGRVSIGGYMEAVLEGKRNVRGCSFQLIGTVMNNLRPRRRQGI